MAERYSVEAVLQATGAREFAKSFQEAGRSVGEVEKNTGKATLSVGKFVGAIGGVAAAVGVFRTLSNAVDGAVSRYDTLNNFPRVLEQIGFSSEESEGAIDRLSEGIQGLPTRLDEVAGTAQRIAVMTNDLEGATETTLALNNAFIASGSSSEDAARGLDQYVQMLSKGEVDLESWRSLQETMGVALNDVAKSFGFAGASAQNDLYEALKEGEVTFDDFNARLIELSTETGGFADRALTASGGIRTAMSNVQTAVVNGVTKVIESIDNFLAQTPLESIQNIFEMMKDAVGDAFTTAAGYVEPLGNALIGLYNIVRPLAPVIITVVSAIMGFVVTVGIINTVTSTIAKLRAGMTALNAVLLANPVGIVIGVLAGLAALFVYLYNTSETFRTKVQEVFSSLLDTMAPVIERLKSSFASIQESMGPVVENLKSAWEGLKPTLITLAQIIGVLFVGALGIMIGAFNGVLQAIGPFLEALSALISFVANVVSSIFLLFTGQWSEAWDYWKQAGSDAIEFFVRIFETVVQFIAGFVTSIIDFFKGLYMTLVGGSIIPDMVNAILDWFRNLWNSAVDIVSNIVSSVVGFFRNLYDGAVNIFNTLRDFIAAVWLRIRVTFMQVVSWIIEFVISRFENLRNNIERIFNAAKSIITTVWETIKSTISTVVSNIYDTVKDTFNSMKDAVSQAFERVKDAVSNGIEGAYNIVVGWVDKFFDAGKNIISNIADGISDGIGAVTGAIENVAEKVASYWPWSPVKEGPLRGLHKVPISQQIAQAIRRGEGQAVGAMRSVAQSVRGELPDVDIAGQTNRLHRRSRRRMSLDYHNAVTVERQPARINLQLGRQQFSAFVEDITTAQERTTQINNAFNR